MATGWLCDERYFWYDAGAQPGHWIEPVEHFEGAASKRRLANLIEASGLSGYSRRSNLCRLTTSSCQGFTFRSRCTG